MSIDITSDDATVEIIPIHFDLDEHSVSIQEFIDAAFAAQTAIEDINSFVFDGKLKYQLRVFPPQEGGFLEIIGVCFIAGLGFGPKAIKSCLEILETDIAKAFIEGLTGKKPDQFAKAIGEALKATITRIPSEKIDNKDLSELIERKTIAVIVTQATINLLQKTPQQLLDIGISKQKFRTSLKARNKLYMNCQNNEKNKGNRI